MIKFLTENIEFIVSLVIVPLITWFFSKRHFQARELDSKDIQNIKSNLGLYQIMIDDLDVRSKARIKELENEIKDLKAEIKRLESLM
jgi:glycine cleavage system regulatory protein